MYRPVHIKYDNSIILFIIMSSAILNAEALKIRWILIGLLCFYYSESDFNDFVPLCHYN